MESIQSRTVAITGASGGLGLALTKVLEDELGYQVIPHVRNEEGRIRLELVRGKTYANCLVADFSDETFLQSEAYHHWLEKSDVLINNAGLYYADYFVDTPPDIVLRMLRINLQAPLLLTQSCLRAFREKGSGVVINISSGSGTHGGLLPSLSYSLSKNGLNHMTAWLAREIQQGDIAVVSIAPKFITTPMLTVYRKFWKKLSKKPVPSEERSAFDVARDVARFVDITYAREFHGQTISI